MKSAMPNIVLGLAAAILACTVTAVNADQTGVVKSLRENAVADDEQAPRNYRNEVDTGRVLPRDFVQQPPLIPHTTQNYQITLNFNKCMDCHSWGRAQVTDSPKISITHFRNASGKELSTVSPNRYFCVQCHVTQTDATPLVENKFQRVPGLN